MYITLAKGQASLQNNTHRGTADVRSDGSVTMREVAHAGPVNLNWRQPNNQICVVAAPDELVLPDEMLGSSFSVLALDPVQLAMTCEYASAQTKHQVRDNFGRYFANSQLMMQKLWQVARRVASILDLGGEAAVEKNKQAGRQSSHKLIPYWSKIFEGRSKNKNT
eukprot:s1617_g9.t1